MDTDELIKSAMDLTMMHGLSEGPRNTSDQLGIATVNVLVAIAQELKRLADWQEAYGGDTAGTFPSMSLLD